MENKSKKLWILLGVIAVIVLIIIVAASEGKKGAKQSGVTEKAGQPAPAGETAAPAETAVTAPVAEILKDARVEAPNANPITKDNKVVTLEGKETKNDVAQTSPLAPAETRPIKKEELASTAIKLEISGAGFSPKEFTVKPGAPVTVAVTSVDQYAHSFVFEDPSLSAIGVGVYKGETRAITFNAPSKAGEYIFFCNVGGHRNRGETGKMIVK